MRKERGLSQTQAFEALRVDLNLGPRSRASYRAIDMGERPPTPREAEVLVRYFGSSPDDVPDIPEDADVPASLVDALKDQTQALRALVEELRLSRQGMPLDDPDEEATAQGRADEAGRLRVVPPEAAGSSEPPAPRGTRE